MYIPPSSNPDGALSTATDECGQATANFLDLPNRVVSPEPDEGGAAEGDVCSPTFSAATVSSVGGLNTPFRLSAGFSRDTSTAWTTDPQAEAMNDIVERLESLDATATGESAPSARGRQRSHHHGFTGYALPHPAVESVHSLAKVTSQEPSIPPDLSVPTFSTSNSAGTMADDIFSELGYLGASIS